MFLAIKKAVLNLDKIEKSNLKELNNKKPDLIFFKRSNRIISEWQRYNNKNDRSRDKNLTDFGRATLATDIWDKMSLTKIFARVASTYADDNLHAQRLYNYISNLWVYASHASII